MTNGDPGIEHHHERGGDPEAEPRSGPVHAAIDIGTNSFHLVVARGLPDGGFEVLTTEKEMVRLGHGSGEMRMLADDAIERGVAALGRMAAVAASHDATISAVATSATREARNRQDFLDRVRAEVGVQVEVISGVEEARLIHLGVLQALPVYDKQLLLVDIGGGSTEFLVGQGSNVLAARSIKLGAIRLTDRFFADGKVTAERVRACSTYVANALVPVTKSLGLKGHDIAVGSSGTISSVVSMIAAGRDEPLNSVNGATFTRAELDALVDRLVEASPKERRSIPGLDAKRVDIIVGGALLLQQIFQGFTIDEMTVSGYALREGVLLDRLGADEAQTARRLTDLRRSNALRLAHQLDPDAAHAETAARLAVELFDCTVDLHGLGPEARELLELAAIVHNVGLFISHAAHHRHTYYVVRHSEQLTGFTERERELLALVARYHRKSHPKPRHPEFTALDAEDQQVVRTLAGILRIAIGLDRSHRGRVRGLQVDIDSGTDDARTLTVVPTVDPGAEIELEIYSAQERSDLLADALGVEIVVASADG